MQSKILIARRDSGILVECLCSIWVYGCSFMISSTWARHRPSPKILDGSWDRGCPMRDKIPNPNHFREQLQSCWNVLTAQASWSHNGIPQNACITADSCIKQKMWGRHEPRVHGNHLPMKNNSSAFAGYKNNMKYGVTVTSLYTFPATNDAFTTLFHIIFCHILFC